MTGSARLAWQEWLSARRRRSIGFRGETLPIVRATRTGKCGGCLDVIRKGDPIARYGTAWVHEACREALVARQRTRDGATFRGTAPTYRRKIKRD